ncbi:MAG: hypothetical protein ACK5O1_02120 [Holosporales bacterium]
MAWLGSTITIFTMIKLDIAGYKFLLTQEVSEKKLATIYKILTELHRKGLLIGREEVEKALQILLEEL